MDDHHASEKRAQIIKVMSSFMGHFLNLELLVLFFFWEAKTESCVIIDGTYTYYMEFGTKANPIRHKIAAQRSHSDLMSSKKCKLQSCRCNEYLVHSSFYFSVEIGRSQN